MPFEPSVPAPNVTVKRSKTKIEVPGFEAVMAVSILLLIAEDYIKKISGNNSIITIQYQK